METILAAIGLGLVIGLVVGTIGGGGALLALPALVYVLGVGLGPATTAALVVVAVAASFGAGAHALGGRVCWRLAARFVVPASLGSLLGTLASSSVGPRLLVLAFVPIMLLAAAATWRRAGAVKDEAVGACPSGDAARIIAAGAGVGFVTGFFGVGGGFLIVPALTVWLGLSFRRAVATSLVIIAVTGAAAVASHLVAVGAALDVPLTAALAGATAAGALLGSHSGRRLPQAALGRGFAIVILLIAAFLLADVLLLGGPPVD